MPPIHKRESCKANYLWPKVWMLHRRSGPNSRGSWQLQLSNWIIGRSRVVRGWWLVGSVGCLAHRCPQAVGSAIDQLDDKPKLAVPSAPDSWHSRAQLGAAQYGLIQIYWNAFKKLWILHYYAKSGNGRQNLERMWLWSASQSLCLWFVLP